MKQRETQDFWVCVALALASSALGASLANAPSLLILACAAFWAGLARKEWRALRSARDAENQAKRRELRQQLLGRRAS